MIKFYYNYNGSNNNNITFNIIYSKIIKFEIDLKTKKIMKNENIFKNNISLIFKKQLMNLKN